jgi:hypothetical protein
VSGLEGLTPFDVNLRDVPFGRFDEAGRALQMLHELAGLGEL